MNIENRAHPEMLRDGSAGDARADRRRAVESGGMDHGRGVELELERSMATAVTPSAGVLKVAAMFGLGADERRTIAVVPPVKLTLRPGEVVFITGPSGSGKSTLLRLIGEALRGRGDVRVIDLAEMPPAPQVPLVDGFFDSDNQSVFGENRPMESDESKARSARVPLEKSAAANPSTGGQKELVFDENKPQTAGSGENEDARLGRVMGWLALAGLNDAFVMLRSPGQLSDGQRYRLRIARALAMAEGEKESAARGRGSARAWDAKPQAGSGARGDAAARGDEGMRGDGNTAAWGGQARMPWCVVLADEFGATLDRVTAKVIAGNVRKWTRRRPVCFVAATTHDDLLDELDPDCVVEQRLGAGIEVARRGEATRDGKLSPPMNDAYHKT